MLKYFVNRILTLIPMLLLISIVVFVCLELTPGDPLTRMISPELLSTLSAENLEAMREAFGLNAPLPIRYVKWLGNILRGDFGYSLVNGAKISQIISNLLPSTLKLSIAALAISTFFGLIFGILSAIYQNTWVDYISSVFGVVGISFPEFFVGICSIQIFAIKLGWLPAQGRMDPSMNWFENLIFLVLPACALGFTLTAALVRYTRGAMLDVLNKDYVKTARAKGLPEWKVYINHAFRNALMPISLLLCMRLPLLIGGSVVIETVFGYSGIGKKLVDSINAKDFPVVMMITMIMAVVTLIASVLVDLFTALLDPRVRLE